MTDVSDATVQQQTRSNGVLAGEVTAAGSELSEDEKKELAALLDDHSMGESEREHAKEHFYQSVRRRREYPLLMSFADPIKAPAREIVGRDYEISQLMAAMNRPELCNAILLAPAGSGKLLPLDTPIPTPSGWMTMGELRPGSVILGRDGHPISVTYESDVELEPELYELFFSDGSSEIACADHQWLVSDNKGSEFVLTTSQILDGILGGESFSIRGAEPLSLPEKVFSIDPYELGVDLSEPSHIRTLGYSRIPAEYLRGSKGQRLELLKGLTNATNPIPLLPGSICDFSIKGADLAEDVDELIRSLGMIPDRTFSVVGSNDTYRFSIDLNNMISSGFFGIEEIVPVDSQPGKCIQVDAPDAVYLCGRSMVPTHNTALVQAAMLQDVKRTYLEVDLARMIAGLNTPDEMASLIKGLFDDAERFSNNEDEQLVLFIDEFHQVVQLSAASVEALKPVLAASGARGIRVIAATTFEEFHQFIAPNQPLVQRLQRINVASPDSKTTVEILRGMAEKYGVGDQFYDDHVFKMIYEYTERFQPANSQPRKSILLLDAMVGWYRHTGRPMDRALLADVLMESTGINVAFRVDAAAIKENLDRAVFGQDMATRVLAKRLQLTVADLHDKSKPNASFLFAGSTGVGKFCTDSTPVPVYSDDGSVAWKNHGDLVTGDQVFIRTGAVSEVLGVFPQGEQDIYRVTLSDGRTLEVGGPHLWAVWTERGLVNVTTEDLLAQGLQTLNSRGEQVLRHWIPMNEPVQWPVARQRMDPYIVGLLLNTGWLSGTTKLFWDGTASLAAQIAESLGVSDWAVVEEGEGGEDLYRFDLGGLAIELRFHLAVLLKRETGIHPDYLYGSVDQRRALSQGIFDAGGYAVPISGGRALLGWVCYEKQQQLAESVSHLLFSLGVSNTLSQDLDGDAAGLYHISVEASRGKAEKLFSDTSVLVDLLEGNELSEGGDDYVGISSIEKLPEQQSASCIYIEDEEHLYQAGEFIVTHNTELTKQLAKLLFGDAQNHMIRFDMSEYALEHNVETFRSELTRNVWDTGHAVLLFDEIEKAASTVTRMLLQVLDDGRLSDDNGRQVSFLNTYIVLTTNAGSEIFETIAQYNVDDEGSGKEMEGKMKEIKRSISSATGDNKFPPELLGRIDAIVPFQPLSRETQRKIVRNKLKKVVQEVLTKHGARVQIDDRVLVYLVDDQVDTDASAGGARGAIQKMTDYVLTEIAAFVNHHPKEKAVAVGIEGTLKAEDKGILKSNAKVEVSAARSSMR